MKTSDFDYSLPPELIAQTPVEPRDRSMLMVLSRSDGSVEHRRFIDILDYLRSGDVLVLNDTRVIPARLAGKRVGSGGRVDILLLKKIATGTWEALLKPGRRLSVGSGIEIMRAPGGSDAGITAEVIAAGPGGVKVLAFSDGEALQQLGEVPLPPYIRAPLSDPGRYQTVYASVDGSVAAPTAGLHFTPELISKISEKGVRCLFVTLHVGLDTFQPVREDNPSDHLIHKEYGVLSDDVSGELSRAKAEGRRVICVGTTATRIVEQAALRSNLPEVRPFDGWTDLFILPGFRFRVTDALITNFHLPRTTLLMLVTAFAGRDSIKRAYEIAIAEKYRFYSFGDCMLIR